MVAYRICEKKGDEYFTLFHGVGGSRKLEFGRWIIADRKMVIDGSDGTEYLSGFNVLPTWKDCNEYLRNFRSGKDLRIVGVATGNVRPKLHSRAPVLLADEIFLLEDVT